MRLSVEAWKKRSDARHALAAGDFATAAELAHQAEQAQSTDQGSALRLLCQWLNATRS